MYFIISYILLKNLQMEHIEEVLCIFNQAFFLGHFPEVWKEGLVIAIPKPGKPPEPVTSLRPITLLSCLGKIYEKIIKNRLEYQAEVDNFLSPSQTGFRKNHTTLDVLLRIENDIKYAQRNSAICLVVYIDLKSQGS